MKKNQFLFSGSAGQGFTGRPHGLLFFGGAWFVTKKVLSMGHILERRAQLSARNFINGLFVFFGAVGLLFVLYEFFQYQHTALDPISFITQRKPTLLLFAISLFFDLAIIARFGRMKTELHQIPRRYRTMDQVPAPQASWTELQPYIDQAEDITPYVADGALRIFEDAYLLTHRFGQTEVRIAHIFASLLSEKDVQLVFLRLGVNPVDFQKRLAFVFSKYDKGATSMSVESERLLLRAFHEAANEDMTQVGALHVLQVIAREKNDATEILYDLGITDKMITQAVQWIMFDRAASKSYQTWRTLAIKKPKGNMNRSYTAVATPLLDTFSRDLTQAARVGALHTTIDRDREFEEIARIFETGRQGIILVGFPGVGKRSIIEGIASRMASEEVPEILQDKRFVELLMPSLIGSATGAGELEERVLRILNEIARAGNVVLFIENIESVVGLSTQGAQNLDISDMLVQAMDRFGLPVIATTTPIKFRQSIESSALMNNFESVAIDEVDPDGAVLILEGRSGVIEYKQKVLFTYGALVKAVELSNRYMHEQYLPEKAINLLQEVASYVATTKGKDTFVHDEDVAVIVSQRANIPVTQVTEEESDKLMRLEEEMHKRIVGQNEAVTLVASALRRARAELRDQKRPIANFLFLGPTGVGKTELAKTVAQVYFGDENNMIRVDMSEYQDQSSLGRLIGSSYSSQPGYLTEAVRTNSFSLVLLDELEKAHPDILNVFLQVMDDGRLTDALGRTIDFTNTIIIATSNARSDFIQDEVRAGHTVDQIKQQLVNQELRQYFRPEFLNRFDGVVVFRPLTFEEIIEIVKLLLKQVSERLEQKGITLQAAPDAIEELARIGFDPVFGARPLRRAIQDRVDNALAESLLQGKVSRRDIAILEKGGKIRVKKAQEYS